MNSENQKNDAAAVVKTGQTIASKQGPGFSYASEYALLACCMYAPGEVLSGCRARGPNAIPLFVSPAPGSAGRGCGSATCRSTPKSWRRCAIATPRRSSGRKLGRRETAASASEGSMAIMSITQWLEGGRAKTGVTQKRHQARKCVTPVRDV